MSNALLAGAFLLMCLCEAYMIRGLWFRLPDSHHHGMRGSDLPFLIWIPSIAGIVLRFAIEKRLKKDEIGALCAVAINNIVGGLLLVSYLLMARLAQVAFN